MIELGPVQIGARELYDLGVATKRSVDLLGADVRGLSGDLVDVRAELADHETRLRAVEARRWPLPTVGAIVALAAAGAAIAALFLR